MELEKYKEQHSKLQESLREEYLGVIESLRQLRKLENDCRFDVKETSQKLSKVSESLESQTKEIRSVGNVMNEELANNINKKEEELERKEKELLRLQQSLIDRQEVSDCERRKLTESILSLEGKLHQKELELESEKRQNLYEKEQLEFKKKQFESEREGFLENLKREKEKMYLDRDQYNKNLDLMKTDLEMQMRTVRKDKVKYDVHRRLRASSAGYEYDQSNAQKMEEFIKVIEEEKSKLRKEKEKQKQESKRIAEAKKKLEIQRRELAEAIEKIYDVEKGIDDKFSDLDKLHKYTKNIKVDSAKVMEDANKLGEGTGEVLADIKDSILELLRQEQRVAGECLKLERERRQLEVTRQTLLCAGCSRPLTKSVSARDVRQDATGAGDWAEMISIR